MPPRLYVERLQALAPDAALPAAAPTPGQCIALTPEAARHAQVLRLQPGDALTLFDGRGGQWQAEVLAMGRQSVQVRLGAFDPREGELPQPVRLALGMPANERMDALVEKATELGAAAIEPLLTRRSVLRVAGERAERKVRHWQAIAQAACSQCGRNRVPPVAMPRSLADWLAAPLPPGTQGLVLSLADNAPPLPARLAEVAAAARGLTPPNAWCLLSGPEGGLAPEEEVAALAAGYLPVSLGPRVLRADTAPLAALALLAAHLEGLGAGPALD